MAQFFQGWRRKAGVAALVVALALTVGWFRSRIVTDIVEFAEWNDGALGFGSDRGSLFLRWMFYTEPSPPGFRFFIPPGWSTWEVPQNAQAVPQDPTWPGGEIRYTRKVFDADDQTAVRAISIPYWYFVTSLTLLSAYLIFWNRRKRVP